MVFSISTWSAGELLSLLSNHWRQKKTRFPMIHFPHWLTQLPEWISKLVQQKFKKDSKTNKIKHIVRKNKTHYGCFQKYGYPQIMNFNGGFHYKPSILGYPYLRKHPHVLLFQRHEDNLPFASSTSLAAPSPGKLTSWCGEYPIFHRVS